MKERNIPPYMADDYVSIAHPSTLRNFKNDLEQVRKYVDMGFQLVLNGEVGRHETTRFVEEPTGESAGPTGSPAPSPRR